MRILALSSWWPEPADNGSRLRAAHLLRALAREHEVHLVAFTQEPVPDVRVASMASVCASIRTIPQRTWRARHSAVVAGLWRFEPASVRATDNPAFAAAVQERAAAVRPDLVIAFETSAARYASIVAGTPRILENVEVMRLWEQYARRCNPRRRMRAYLTWWKHRRYLRWLLHSFDACTVVSTLEQQRVHAIAPRGMPISVIPNGADESTYPETWGDAEQDTLIYPGALSFDANFDAMAYFLKMSFPLIKQSRPQVRLRITGRAEAAQREALQGDGVEYTGYVPDVRPLVARSWGEVVPLRIGGGTRLKVLEALALGTPVVSTSKGVEGLDLQDGQHVLVANSPRDFAAATVQLLSQPELRTRLALGGRQVVREKYDWRVIGTQLNRLVGDTCVLQRHITRHII